MREELVKVVFGSEPEPYFENTSRFPLSMPEILTKQVNYLGSFL